MQFKISKLAPTPPPMGEGVASATFIIFSRTILQTHFFRFLTDYGGEVIIVNIFFI